MAGSAWTVLAWVSTGKPLYRPFPWKYILIRLCGAGLGVGNPHPHPTGVTAALLLHPLLKINRTPSNQATLQPLGHPIKLAPWLPAPHLQPSSSSSWPLPHVWFPLATRQILGVTLPGGGWPPLGPSSLPPPLLGSLPIAVGGGGHPQLNIVPHQLRGRQRPRGVSSEFWALLASPWPGWSHQCGFGHVA